MLSSFQGHRVRCTLFRKCGILQWSRFSLCGWRRRLWQCWCVWWSSVRGSEAERPSGVSSLTTGRTPEPLNPGLHSARSTAPRDSSRALTAPVFWLDPRQRPPPHKYSPEGVSVCSCFLWCLWLSHSFTLSPQPGPGGKQTLPLAGMFKAPKTPALTSTGTYIKFVQRDP